MLKTTHETRLDAIKAICEKRRNNARLEISPLNLDEVEEIPTEMDDYLLLHQSKLASMFKAAEEENEEIFSGFLHAIGG
jgi:hypothetical protein